MTEAPRRIGILLFDDIELLDFAGPLQVFTSLQSLFPETIDTVDTIGLSRVITVSKCLLEIKCQLTIEEAGNYDLIVIPGGMGTRSILKNKCELSTIKSLIDRSKITTSVCTGSLILAKLGLLHNKRATTHHKALDLLQELDETIIIDRASRYIDHGQMIISQGVSAGIDMSFYLVEKYHGKSISEHVRDYIEYHPE